MNGETAYQWGIDHSPEAPRCPDAYDAGFAYGQKYGLHRSDFYGPREKFADGYSGAEIRAADDETPLSMAYSAYCAGYGAGVRSRKGPS